MTGDCGCQPPEIWDAGSDTRYLLHERVGIGATAQVFRGTDHRDGRPVAIKVAALADKRNGERIAAEAVLMEGLRHPALVKFVDKGTGAADSRWAGRPFLVQELVYGSSLAETIRWGPVPGSEVAPWAVGLLSGLRHLHARGIVHRDIKPANLLLSRLRKCPVRIIDFGIAAPAGTEPEPGTSSGTVQYMSPEQANGETVRPADDIYALGLVLLECLTGVKAFPGTAVESLVARTLRSPGIPQHLGPQWASLLGSMTARHAAVRPTALEATAEAAMLLQRPHPLRRRVEARSGSYC
ncbi:serine/threonine protein kinase [Arthrobacter sp. PvP023]|uniref:serine/threonine-protein kinase n=1 Tax=Micrococcaceae TaxID=1268 RepID=UPI001AE888AF|nr:serine/threonine-protein kinase [Arthrobacter sp. PvP023]MBP1134179.1 serine/threonine protein kinase [Arthrobacter sp. PvP023]